MSETATPSQAKFREEYQAKDEWGNPIGPPQVFEAETQKELIKKLVAANENASAALYRTKRDSRLGDLLLDADPEEPLPEYKERPLTADERVKLKTAMNDPSSLPEAFKTLLEAQFGASPERIREALTWIDLSNRGLKVQENVRLFRIAHPEYVESEANRDEMQAYLTKHKLAFTKKNLEKAYEVLKADGALTIRADKPTPTSAGSPQTVQQTAPPPVETIPPPATAVAPISEPAVVQAVAPTSSTPSSSGLSSRAGSAPQAAPEAKPEEVSWHEINSLTSAQYAAKLKDPKFVAAVEKLMGKK